MSDKENIYDHVSQKLTPIQVAVVIGDLQRCKELVGAGADLKVRDDMVDCLLAVAAREGRAEVCRYLIGLGFNVHDPSYNGQTPLFKAAMRGHTEVIALLVEHGAQAVLEDRCSQTPLHLAAYHGRLSACRMLVDLGLDPLHRPEFADRSYKTPFGMALQGDQIEVVRYFVLGAKVKLEPKHLDLVGNSMRGELRSLMTEQAVRVAVDSNQTDVEVSVPRSRGLGML